MKKIVLLFLFFIGIIPSLWSNPIRYTIEHGGYEREYLLYIPDSFNTDTDLIVCLHGFNSSMHAFFNEYNIKHIADSLNMMVLAPQALPEKTQRVIDKASELKKLTGIEIPLKAVWGCGLNVKTSFFPFPLDEELNRDIDDVSFIRKIIDQTLANYNLTHSNKFILGTSMGGFMSYQYALFHGNDLSGLISICGSMGTAIKNKEANITLPVCDFHSTTDEVVPYSGTLEYNAIFFKVKISLCEKKDQVVNFWIQKNGTASNAEKENVNYYPSDKNITIEKQVYVHQENEVIHYKITGANHEYYFKKENGDRMDYNEEIAKFIASHSEKENTGIVNPIAQSLMIYPNPATDIVQVNVAEGEATVYDLNGKAVLNSPVENGYLNVHSLTNGLYIIRIINNNQLFQNKLIIIK